MVVAHKTHRAFFRSERGNVAIIFALTALPLIAMVGGAIDFSRAYTAKVALQTALDSTALMLAKEAATDTATQLQANAQKYLLANFKHAETKNVQVTASYITAGGSQVVVSGTGTEPTSFLQVLGFKTLDIGGSSTAKWGMSRLRVALVLDNTGSMAMYGKLTALQTATKNLLSQLQSAAATNADVYVSIVPFVKDVNVGASNYGASWIDWTDWNANNGTCGGWAWGGGWGWGWGGGVSAQSSCGSTWTPGNHNTWNGCITDRGNSNGPASGNYDTNVIAPSTGNAPTLYTAEQYSACPQAVKGLSYDWSGMTWLVNNMTANGTTNQAIGLQMGWLSLVGGGPFTAPAMDPNYAYQQVIILLTDGLNTQNRWFTNQASIDARQQLTCNNIKAAGITLYTSKSTRTAIPPRLSCKTAQAIPASSFCSRQPTRSSLRSTQSAPILATCTWRNSRYRYQSL
jgi:Putative Flp pilus-assembly TadE/G-like